MPNVFSIPIFFIVFRETLEAAIIISVLLGLVEQIVSEDQQRKSAASPLAAVDDKDGSPGDTTSPNLNSEEEKQRFRRLVKRMRWQIFAGSATGLFIALAIGAAFIAVWFTKASDLWSKSEALWEGTFVFLNLSLPLTSRFSQESLNWLPQSLSSSWVLPCSRWIAQR